jgi:hypothetical protein
LAISGAHPLQRSKVLDKKFPGDYLGAVTELRIGVRKDFIGNMGGSNPQAMAVPATVSGEHLYWRP